MLIHRPIPSEGESWPGYLQRLAQINYLNGIEELARVFNAKGRELVASNPIQILSQLKYSYPNDSHWRAIKNYTRVSIKTRAIRLYGYGRTLRARVCSLCLKESDKCTVTTNWDRAFKYHCDKHKIYLIENCQSCHNEISFLRKRIEACDCGFHYADSLIQKAEETFDDFYFACELKNEYESGMPSFSTYSRSEQYAFYFLNRIYKLRDGKYGNQHKNLLSNDGFVSLETMTSLNPLFKNWPNNFNHFLHQKIKELGKTPKQLLFASPLNESAVLPKIRQAIAATANCWQKPKIRKVKPKPLQSFGNSDTVNLAFLRSQAGCSKNITQFWMENGWLGPVTTVKNKRNRYEYLISRIAAQKAIQICKSTESPLDITKLIGISIYALRHCVRSKVLTGIRYGKSINNFRLLPQECFELTRRIFEVAKFESTNAVKQISMEEAICIVSETRGSLLQKLFKDIHSSELTLNKSAIDVISLNQISVNKMTFDEWLFRSIRSNASS